MLIACWIPKATDTNSEYVIPLFHGSIGYANAPHCYVTLIFPALLGSCMLLSVAT